MDIPNRTAPRLLCLIFGIALVLICLPAVSYQDGRGARAGAPAGGPFDYFRNSWAVIGLPDYERGTRLTPDDQLLLQGTERVTIEFGNPFSALSRHQTKTLLEGWIPVVLIESKAGDVRYEFLIWAAPLPGSPDITAAFNGPAEGENFANWILVRATNAGKTATKAAVRIKDWIAAKDFAAVAEPPEVKAPAVAAKNLSVHEWSPVLGPGETSEDSAAFPFRPVPQARSADLFRNEKASVWLDRTISFWKTKLAGAARIEVPEKKAAEALRAAHVCQLLAMDRGELHAGEGFYDVFYIRDGAYQVMALEEAGLAAEARRAMESFLGNQRPDGRFETQKGQFDANGQALWALWQYAAITGDRAWLERVYTPMKKAAEWTIAARKQSAADRGCPGLLPAAPADGEYLWEGKNHIVGYALWNLRGLLCAADAARRLGRLADVRELESAAKDYRTSIDKAWEGTGLPYFPPSWEKAGTPWGNTEILWPVRVTGPDDARVAALSRYVRMEYAGGYKEGAIRWVAPKVKPAIHPYMGAYTALNDLERGRDEDVVRDFYAYLLHSTAAQAFPEGVHFEERTAWGETIPHATGAGNYALLLRHMLIHETDDLGKPGELHLLAAVPDWWLEDGRTIIIERAPTRFGEMDFRIKGAATGVHVEVRLPRRSRPGKVILHLPQSRPLIGRLPGVEVSYRPDQIRRWDFDTVVREYEKTAPPIF